MMLLLSLLIDPLLLLLVVVCYGSGLIRSPDRLTEQLVNRSVVDEQSTRTIAAAVSRRSIFPRLLLILLLIKLLSPIADADAPPAVGAAD